ncbi:MAG: class I SAM-dependent methyltransferase [Thermoleophilia bacterium]
MPAPSSRVRELLDGPGGGLVGVGPSAHGRPGTAARGTLARALRPHLVAERAVVEALVEAVEALEARMAAVENREPTAPADPPVWQPPDLETAMASIYNTTDAEAFDASGAQQADELADHLTPDRVVMDLGCGIGRVARHVAPRVGRLIAADSSPAMLAFAQERMPDADNVDFVTVEGTRIPVADDEVDFAYSLVTLQHLERESAFLLLRELRRVMRPGATAHLTFANLAAPEYLTAFVRYAENGDAADPRRARFYTEEELRIMLETSGFEAVGIARETELVAVVRA